MKKNILIIMMGQLRGGDYGRSTQKKYLVDHLNADLAICFGDERNNSDQNIKGIKYNWNFEEYTNWRKYFSKYFSQNIFENLEKGKDWFLMGGIDSYTGSGAKIFAIRDILLRNHIDIIETYDQVILTRSDYIYLDYHPKLDKKNIWVVEGEDYFGITDRHYVFPGKEAKSILGICDYLDMKDIYKEWPDPKNPEVVLMSYLKHVNLYDHIKRFKRTQMIVKRPSLAIDDSDSRHGLRLFFFKDLYAKKISEFEDALNNLNLFKNFNYLNLRLKLNYYLFQLKKLINNLSFKIIKKRIFVQ